AGRRLLARLGRLAQLKKGEARRAAAHSPCLPAAEGGVAEGHQSWQMRFLSGAGPPLRRDKDAASWPGQQSSSGGLFNALAGCPGAKPLSGADEPKRARARPGAASTRPQAE
ncbi:unnamed protein product, partial [Symbiodinium microadriaticum]